MRLIAELSDQPSVARDVTEALIAGDDATITAISDRIQNAIGKTFTARDLGAPYGSRVVRRDNPARVGRLYAVYGDDDLTATRVKVAWGDDVDTNPIYLGDRGQDENVADLIPALVEGP